MGWWLQYGIPRAWDVDYSEIWFCQEGKHLHEMWSMRETQIVNDNLLRLQMEVGVLMLINRVLKSNMAMWMFFFSVSFEHSKSIVHGTEMATLQKELRCVIGCYCDRFCKLCLGPSSAGTVPIVAVSHFDVFILCGRMKFTLCTMHGQCNKWYLEKCKNLTFTGAGS